MYSQAGAWEQGGAADACIDKVLCKTSLT